MGLDSFLSWAEYQGHSRKRTRRNVGDYWAAITLGNDLSTYSILTEKLNSAFRHDFIQELSSGEEIEEYFQKLAVTANEATVDLWKFFEERNIKPLKLIPQYGRDEIEFYFFVEMDEDDEEFQNRLSRKYQDWVEHDSRRIAILEEISDLEAKIQDPSLIVQEMEQRLSKLKEKMDEL